MDIRCSESLDNERDNSGLNSEQPTEDLSSSKVERGGTYAVPRKTSRDILKAVTVNGTITLSVDQSYSTVEVSHPWSPGSAVCDRKSRISNGQGQSEERGASAAKSQTNATNDKDRTTTAQPKETTQISYKEVPYPGYHLTSTIHHEPYPEIDPLMANLGGKVVFVSGASKGIGRATALAFARSGASGIVIAARSTALLDDIESEIVKAAALSGKPTNVLKIVMDVADDLSIHQAATLVDSTFGRLDVLLNFAANIDSYTPLSTCDMDEWWSAWTVNIRGTCMVIRSLLPLLAKSEIPGKMVINVVSFMAHIITPVTSGYNISKLALMRMTEVLQREYRDRDISILAVHPGCVPTTLTAVVPESMRSILIDSPDLAANSLVWLAKEPRNWLGGRYVSCTWDMIELEQMKDEIVSGDKLKIRMSV